jgi:cellulose synthase/poly-beta-1,6-N-acetylglucosamine synthase-like glycosyltransferase
MIAVELLLLAYFVYVVGYTLTFAMAGYGYKRRQNDNPNRYSNFAVLIPSYKEDNVILEVARQAIRQHYPQQNFQVFIIADSLKTDTIEELKKLPLTVIEVSFESSTKVKSLNHALENIPEGLYDFAVILDADNVMESTFLARMNGMVIQHNCKAVQGQRKPKNKNNNLAFLDGVSEAINNHIYRQGTVALGLSSSISGSGIVLDFKLLKEKLSKMNSVGGYDRELELKFIQEKIPVYYYKDAVVFDEKVSRSQSFQNQRKRWISSQYIYLAKYFREGCVALFKGDFVFFNSAVLRNIQLPRLINLGLLTLLMIVSLFLHNDLIFGREIWIALFLLNSFSILISIPREFYSTKMLRAFFDLPGIFINMVLLLFRLKDANKKFIHTQHGIASQK